MYGATSDILEKKAMNATLENLSESVKACLSTVGLSKTVILDVFLSELYKEEMNEEMARLKKIPSILGVNGHVVRKWTVYTDDRKETRQQLLEEKFDLRNVEIIDGA